MPMPEGAQLNQSFSPILTNIALSFIPKMTGMIAQSIFPVVPTASPTGSYNIWKLGDFLRRSMKKLANAEPAPRGGFSTGTGTFTVAKYGIGTTYTAMDLNNARRGGSSDQKLINAKTYYVTSQAMLEVELQVANIINTSGNWTLSVAGVTTGAVAGTSFLQWDLGSSTPIDDILDLTERMRLSTGYGPNKIVMGQQVWLSLRKNLQLLSRITYGGTMDRPTQITMQQLKSLFEIDDISVGKEVYNTAAEGQADSLAYIWGKFVWIGYVAPAPSAEEPSAGYMFSWTGDTTVGLPAGVAAGAGPQSFNATGVQNQEGVFIREYLENRPAQMVIESELWKTPNVTSAALGTLMTGVIS